MDLDLVTSQEILERISRHCPEALCTYFHCINRVNSKRKFLFTKSLVEIDMSLGWAKFRNHIKKLALENLLEWHPFNGGISITLAEINENE